MSIFSGLIGVTGRRRRMATVGVGLFLQVIMAADVGAFQSPMEVPAVASALAARTPLMSVAHAGQRIVAVGPRGHIVYSDDEGTSWTQAKVPVSSDLVAVSFPSARMGWAVGHGGVVIQTEDGGATWTRLIDGQGFSDMAVAYYEKLAVTNPTLEITHIAEKARASADDGSTKALLDVYFESETVGYVVGAFNRIFRTDDGGKTWTPWMERTSNPRELHFYSIRSNGGRVLLTGEEGMVWELNPAKQLLEPKPTPYKGTLFGSVVSDSNVFVFGMRGSVFRSGDDGATWTKVEVPSMAGITGGVSLDRGRRVVLATQAGAILVSEDSGNTFKTVRLAHPMSYFGIGTSPKGALTLVGIDGVQVELMPGSVAAANPSKH